MSPCLCMCVEAMLPMWSPKDNLKHCNWSTLSTLDEMGLVVIYCWVHLASWPPCFWEFSCICLPSHRESHGLTDVFLCTLSYLEPCDLNPFPMLEQQGL